MILEQGVRDTGYVSGTKSDGETVERYTSKRLSTLLRSVYGNARSVMQRSIPLTPLAIAHAARTKLATSPDGNPYPINTMRFPVNRPFNRIMIGWVMGPEVVR